MEYSIFFVYIYIHSYFHLTFISAEHRLYRNSKCNGVSKSYYFVYSLNYDFLKYMKKSNVLNACINLEMNQILSSVGARCSSVVRAFSHGAMGCRIDPSWGGPIELFLVPSSCPRLV